MEINMKDTLRALRQKKSVTQEALANHLGITPQSVGKWERGEGFPDITLLPSIALYFNVTIDDLLNVGKARIDEKVQAYQDESRRYKNAGKNEENLALWERAYAEFPNDCRVMAGLMKAINQEEQWPCPKEKAERITSLGERILLESADTQLRESAIQSLCYTYNSIGDEENALRYADMGGSIYTTNLHFWAVVLKGEAGIEACQNYIISLLVSAAQTAQTMLTKSEFTPNEEIAAYEFGIHLMKLLFEDDNVGFYANDISMRYSYIARNYAKLGDAENTLHSLEECAKYAVISSNVKEMQYTAPMVNRVKHNPADTVQNYKGNVCNLRLKELEWNGYDFVRKDKRFQKIVGDLEASAKL